MAILTLNMAINRPIQVPNPRIYREKAQMIEGSLWSSRYETDGSWASTTSILVWYVPTAGKKKENTNPNPPAPCLSHSLYISFLLGNWIQTATKETPLKAVVMASKRSRPSSSVPEDELRDLIVKLRSLLPSEVKRSHTNRVCTSPLFFLTTHITYAMYSPSNNLVLCLIT